MCNNYSLILSSVIIVLEAVGVFPITSNTFTIQSVFSILFCIATWFVYEKSYVNEKNVFSFMLFTFFGSVSFSFSLFIVGLINFIKINGSLVLWLIINVLVILNSLVFGYRSYKEALLLKNNQTCKDSCVQNNKETI